MCCVVEIVMSVVGLITLIRGEIQLSSRLMMRGTRAYLIGGMLLSTFPLALACGVLLGVALAAQGVSPEQMPERVREFWWLDFIVVFGVMLGALVIALLPGGETVAAAPKRRKRRKPRALPPDDFGDESF